MGKNKNKNRDVAMSDLPDTLLENNSSINPPDEPHTEEEIISDSNNEQPKETIMANNNPPKTEETTAKPAVAPVRQNTNLDKLKKLEDQFEEAFNKKEDTIGTLISICNFLNTTNDPKVFQAFTTWFAQREETCMNEEVALRGIHTIQNKKTKTRVEATHQCFVELARVLRSRPRSRYRFTVRSMRAMEISERLAAWIHQKAIA